MRPVGVFESGVNPGEWREVTVNGHVRKMREERSSRVPGEEVGGKMEGEREEGREIGRERGRER